jgi:membrane protein YdbS with pleckstrin-like domain
MERNIDRNLRMARREVRRFFGVGRRIAGEAVFIIAMIIVSTVYFATERGLIILVGILAVAALIFFILERVFGVYLWRRPRHEFFLHKRGSEAPRRIGWRYRKNSGNPAKNGPRPRKP